MEHLKVMTQERRNSIDQQNNLTQQECWNLALPLDAGGDQVLKKLMSFCLEFIYI